MQQSNVQNNATAIPAWPSDFFTYTKMASYVNLEEKPLHFTQRELNKLYKLGWAGGVNDVNDYVINVIKALLDIYASLVSSDYMHY